MTEAPAATLACAFARAVAAGQGRCPLVTPWSPSARRNVPTVPRRSPTPIAGRCTRCCASGRTFVLRLPPPAAALTARRGTAPAMRRPARTGGDPGRWRKSSGGHPRARHARPRCVRRLAGHPVRSGGCRDRAVGEAAASGARRGRALSTALAPLLAAVQSNCHLSDARHAQDLTLCNYLLAMREYYRWEHDLPMQAVPPRGEVGALDRGARVPVGDARRCDLDPRAPARRRRGPVRRRGDQCGARSGRAALRSRSRPLRQAAFLPRPAGAARGTRRRRDSRGGLRICARHRCRPGLPAGQPHRAAPRGVRTLAVAARRSLGGPRERRRDGRGARMPTVTAPSAPGPSNAWPRPNARR